jgi:RNA polymerase sigma-70 factor (ECF subfamily)
VTAHLVAERPTHAASGRPCEQPRAELARLLARSADGDVEAFLDFYDRTCGTAYHLARAVCGDADRAGELVQRLYVSAWVRAGQQEGSGLSPLAWLLAEVARSARPSAGGHPTRG